LLPVEVIQVEILHHKMTSDRAVFETAVLPLLQTPPGSFTAPPDPVLPAGSVSAVQFTRVFTGAVAPGASEVRTIQIEPGIAVASFALFDPSQSLSVAVRGASGNVITLDTAANGFVEVDDPGTLVSLGYGFENPAPGPWEVTLTAGAQAPAAGAAYALTARLQGGASLEAEATPLLPSLGDPVRLSGSLLLEGLPVTLESALAMVRDPEGGTREVALTTAGNAFEGTWSPAVPGPHSIDVVVTGRLPDGSLVERAAFLAAEAQPRPNLLPTVALLAGCALAVVAGLAGAGLLAWRFARRRRGAG
jgi:hypothetical protein